MSGFWSAYANINDDIRHKLVEEGWFGKQVTPNLDASDIPALAENTPGQAVNSFYGTTHESTAIGSFYAGPSADPTAGFYGEAAVEASMPSAAKVEAPKIEAPEISAPQQPSLSQDM